MQKLMSNKGSFNEPERLLHAEQEARHRIEQLQTLTEALSAARTSEEIAKATLEVGRRVIGSNRGAVCRVFEQEFPEASLEIVGTNGYDVEELQKWRSLLSVSPAHDVVRTAHPVLISRRSEYLRRYPALAEWLETQNIFSTAIFPLHALTTASSGAPEAVHGFVSFDFDRDRELTESEVQFLSALARLCWQALDRARLSDADRATREKLESVLGGMSDGLVMVDYDWRFTYVNPKAEQMLRVSHGELLGRSLWEAYAPALGTMFEFFFRKAMEERMPVNFEAPCEPLALWLEARAFPTPHGLAIFFLDIAARHEALVALQAREAQLQAIFDTAPVGLLFAKAPDGILISGNRKAAEILGHPELLSDKLSGYDERVAVHADGRDVAIDEYPLVRALRGESRAELECLYRRGDGRLVWIHNFAEPVRDAEGKITGALVAAVDVDREHRALQALKELTEELRETQLRLDVALDAGRMGVWHWCPASDEAHWNRQMFELLGLPPGVDARGLASPLFIAATHPEDRPLIEAGIEKTRAGYTPPDTETRVVHPNGEVRWIHNRSKAIFDEQGTVTSIVGVSFDVTEQKLAQQSLLEADRHRNEFLAMLGHELRNPLAPIANAVRLLEKKELRPDQYGAAVQIIRRQSEQLARLVDDLLEVSRVTQGRIELYRENILAITAVLSAAESVRPLMRDQAQELEIDVPTDVHLLADPARLTQIVANLLSNAAKYTQRGGRVSVRARAVDETWFEIAVADNGAGIEPDLLPRVFDLFSQGAATIDRSRGGLGVGLALVKRLVEMHGGSVRAESAGLGQGATFTVRLPLPMRAETPHSVHDDSSAAVEPRSILVVDDNADAAHSLATLLECDGHEVRVAYDGISALEVAREFRPQVVLLDIGLPKLDGYAVARALRREPNLAKTIIIAVSGYGQRPDREKSKLAGFDAHLLKPAELTAIYRAMQGRE